LKRNEMVTFNSYSKIEKTYSCIAEMHNFDNAWELESFSTAEFRILYPGAPSVINFNYISPSTTNFYARCWNYDNKKLTNFTGYTIYYEAYKSTEPTKVNVNTIDIVHDVESHDYSIASQANKTDTLPCYTKFLFLL